jgi:uncharacterized protein (DUF433 family)
MDWKQHVGTNPNVLYGKPVIKNTRIPVDLILEKLAVGDTVNDLMEAYPNITREDINACLFFAADAIKNELVYLKAS